MRGCVRKAGGFFVKTVRTAHSIPHTFDRAPRTFVVRCFVMKNIVSQLLLALAWTWLEAGDAAHDLSVGQ